MFNYNEYENEKENMLFKILDWENSTCGCPICIKKLSDLELYVFDDLIESKYIESVNSEEVYVIRDYIFEYYNITDKGKKYLGLDVIG